MGPRPAGKINRNTGFSSSGLLLAALVAALSLAFTAKADSAQPQALEFAGINALRNSDPNLTGSGVKLGVVCRSLTYTDGIPQNDYQPNTGHSCLKNKHILFHEANSILPTISPHATAITSILAGEDPNASYSGIGSFYYLGAVPDANLEVFEFWQFVTEYAFIGTAPKADILSMSLGSPFEDWWTRGIQAMAEKTGIIVVAGIGNGSNLCDPVLYPAAGANVIGVGVADSVNTAEISALLGNFSLPNPQHSSVGPEMQGRCKPDIIAPGNCLVASAAGSSDYQITGNWSSFATPIVAGTCGLLVQKAKQDSSLAPAIDPNGGNCVIKAILLSSASKLPYWHKGLPPKDDDHTVPLDYIQGSGMLDALKAYKVLSAGMPKSGNTSPDGWDNNLLEAADNNSVKTYRFSTAGNASDFISAALVWNRHYQSKYPFSRINDTDLRLELWAIDPNNPQRDYLLDYSDSRIDNVEYIYSRPDPNFTDYELVVSFGDASADSNNLDERYGLAFCTVEPIDAEDIRWYDLNNDGKVNILDLAVLSKSFGQSSQANGSCIYGDTDMNGVIDFKDLQNLSAHRGQTADWLQPSGD